MAVRFVLVAQQHAIGVEELCQSLPHGHLVPRCAEVLASHELQETQAEVKLLIADWLRRVAQEGIEVETGVCLGRPHDCSLRWQFFLEELE